MSDASDIVTRALERRRADPTQLLQILREIQEELGWVSPETARSVAVGLGIPTTQVESVVQFYAFLYDQPRGRYRILFSDNITDRMLGSLTLFESMLKRLKLRRAEVSADGAVSVDLDLMHRNVRSGPGAACQQPSRHASDRAACRRDLRACARRRFRLLNGPPPFSVLKTTSAAPTSCSARATSPGPACGPRSRLGGKACLTR